MKSRIYRFAPVALALSVITLLCFTATSYAAGAAVQDESSIVDLLKPVYDAFSGGHYAYAASLGVVLAVALVKRYLGDHVAWLHTDMGGTAMALVASAAAAMASGLAAPDAAVTLSLLEHALVIGVGAAGGYAVVKALLVDPLLKPLEAKAPAWLQPVFGVVTWIFEKPDSVAPPAAPAAPEGKNLS